MSTSENFLRAAFKSSKARIKKIIIDSAYETAHFIKKAPEVIKQEWIEFKEEVSNEADRLDNEEKEEVSFYDSPLKTTTNPHMQSKVDQIRKKIAKLNNQVEELN